MGDEVAFAVEGPDAATAVWTVNGGDETAGALVAFTPSEPGRYRVAVEVGEEAAEHVYEADGTQRAVRIEGSGLAPVGQTTTLRVVGADGRPVTWTIAGDHFRGRHR